MHLFVLLSTRPFSTGTSICTFIHPFVIHQYIYLHFNPYIRPSILPSLHLRSDAFPESWDFTTLELVNKTVDAVSLMAFLSPHMPPYPPLPLPPLPHSFPSIPSPFASAFFSASSYCSPPLSWLSLLFILLIILFLLVISFLLYAYASIWSCIHIAPLKPLILLVFPLSVLVLILLLLSHSHSVYLPRPTLIIDPPLPLNLIRLPPPPSVILSFHLPSISS